MFPPEGSTRLVSWEGRSTKGATGTQRLATLGDREARRRPRGKSRVWVMNRANREGLSASRSRECSLTDVGVASDLAKDVHLSPCGIPHLLQLLKTQPLS